MHLECVAVAAAAAPLLGRWMENRAAMVPLGAWRAAAAVGCRCECVCAQCGARRVRAEAAALRWLAERCSGCRFERRLGKLLEPKAAPVSMRNGRLRSARGVILIGAQ